MSTVLDKYRAVYPTSDTPQSAVTGACIARLLLGLFRSVVIT